ncbi:MAG: hypothetical protein QOD84_64 [Acidobacteriaceae bacterium]|jgi:hypothetical protein
MFEVFAAVPASQFGDFNIFAYLRDPSASKATIRLGRNLAPVCAADRTHKGELPCTDFVRLRCFQAFSSW